MAFRKLGDMLRGAPAEDPGPPPTYPKCEHRIRHDVAPDDHCCRCDDFRAVPVGDRPMPAYPDFRETVWGRCPQCRGGADAVPQFCARARIPEPYRTFTVARWCRAPNGDAHAGTIVRQWVEAFPQAPPFLVLRSALTRAGNGKTALACAAAVDLYRAHSIEATFWSVPELLEEYRRGFDDRAAGQRLDVRCRTVGLLILDDLAAEQQTDWSKAKLFDLINDRYVNRRHTIVTSNAASSGLVTRVSSRLSDHQVSTILELTGPDRREGAFVPAGAQPRWAGKTGGRDARSAGS